MATERQTLIDKINGETAKIPWRELQTYFAAGNALAVNADEDMIQVAAAMAEDNSMQVKGLLEGGKLGPVSDEQASTWYEEDTVVWATVVRPWVLVQAFKQA